MTNARSVLFAALLLGVVTTTVSGTSANIVQLNYGNISKIYKGDWLAVFHMPGCRFCNDLMGVIPDVAKEIDTSVQIALIEASSSYPIRKQFHVKRFPTVYYVHDGECRAYEGHRTAEKIAEYVGGGWIRDDPIIGPMAPCGTIMRFWANYVDVVTGMYAVAERWARSLDVNVVILASVGTGLVVLVFGAVAIIAYGNIHNARVEKPEKPRKGGEAGPRAQQENEPQRGGQSKGQKIEISRTATISGKIANKNSALRQRKKKKK